MKIVTRFYEEKYLEAASDWIKLFIILAIFYNSLVTTEFCYAVKLTPPEDMPSGEYEIDKAHTSVIFRVNHLGLSNYTGRFTQVDGKLNFDPNNFENITVEASVSPVSIRTEYPYQDKKDFDHELSFNKEWFNSKLYPEVSMRSSSIKMEGKNKAKLNANIKMLGREIPVVFDVKFNGAMKENPFTKESSVGFSARSKIRRSDWGMKTYIPEISDEVELIIESEFTRKGPEKDF